MSFKCAKEGVTRLYARQCQGMLDFQGMSGSDRECQGMLRNVGGDNTCHLVPRDC